jgi:hypothetical protein
MSDTRKQMIETHYRSDKEVEELTRKAVFKAEGRMEEYPRQVGGDRTVTYGFGYTFIRFNGKRWGIYEHLEKDLAAIGIKLTKAEYKQLLKIAETRNNKKFSEVNKLISQFEKDWAKDHKPLTNDKAITF